MKKTSKLLILAGAIGAVAGVIAVMKGTAEEEPPRKTWPEAQDAPEMPDTPAETEAMEKSNEADEVEAPEMAAVTEEGDEAKTPGVKDTTLVKVLPTGPRTAAVRPTEEEEKELLRQRLERTIRF